MKKFIWLLLIVGIAFGTLWYLKNNLEIPRNTDTKMYRNTNLGLSFSYPNILIAETKGEIVNLHHQVPFTHHDYCDFKGEATTTIDTLTDFHVTFRISNRSIEETIRLESPYIPEENFVNGKVVPSPGFIDQFEANGMKGFKIFEGAEGCGHTVYYLPAGNSKTLIIQEEWVTVFSGVIDIENKEAAEAVPGVINKEKSEEIFKSIIETLEVN